jgi:SAM-dependent methyltransferase
VSEYDAAAFDAFEAAGWTTKDPAVYDSLAGRVTSRVADPLLDAVGAGPGTRLLDIATGPGYVVERAVERGSETTGLDFSETMLAHARSRVPSAELVHGNATGLPFADASFDAVTAAFLLLHLGRPERAVAEAARVLKPSGRAAFSVWDEPSRCRWIGVVFEAFAASGGQPPPDVPAGPSQFQFADAGLFTRLLEGAGLTEVDVDTVEFALHLESTSELWDGLAQGSVRLQPMMIGQPRDVQRVIRERFDELLEEYRTTEGFEVPVSVKLAVGTKA